MIASHLCFKLVRMFPFSGTGNGRSIYGPNRDSGYRDRLPLELN